MRRVIADDALHDIQEKQEKQHPHDSNPRQQPHYLRCCRRIRSFLWDDELMSTQKQYDRDVLALLFRVRKNLKRIEKDTTK